MKIWKNVRGLQYPRVVQRNLKSWKLAFKRLREPLLAKNVMMAYCCGISFHEKKNLHTSYSQVVKASRTLICV